MTPKRKIGRRPVSVMLKAEKALRIAVADAIEDHRRSGDPIVVWKNGRVVKLPANRIPRRRPLDRR